MTSFCCSSVAAWAALTLVMMSDTKDIVAQNAATSAVKLRRASIMGVVVSANPSVLQVKSFEGTISVALAPGAKIWKKTVRSDFSDIQPGDRVLMRGQKDASGHFFVNEIWSNIVSFHGRILSTNGTEYDVRVDLSDQVRKVIVDSTTLGDGDSLISSGDMQLGRSVQVIGLELPSGLIEATRVIPDTPLQDVSPGATITDPNGQRHPK